MIVWLMTVVSMATVVMASSDQIASMSPKSANHHKASHRGNINSLEKAAAIPQNSPSVGGAAKSLMGNEGVQDAVAGKVIEVGEKLVDKYFENIEQAHKNAKDFRDKKLEFKMDLNPEKGFESPDSTKPPEYHIDAEVGQHESEEAVEEPPPVFYPAGVGQVMMNGCFGKDYQEGDPCYDAVKAGNATACSNMIDGAAFIGVGFDGAGEYSESSRKMSIIQRDCAGKSMYDDFQVPDTMNVFGIYDTTASSVVFESSNSFRMYLQKQSATSGSVLGFSAGVKSAYGSSLSIASQVYLSLFDINVVRYEIFKDEVKPTDLSRAFLREFLNLPSSYTAPNAPEKYTDFIQRWGTHYIKAARFGGQLEFRKIVKKTSFASKVETQKVMEANYNALFWSASAKSSKSSSESAEMSNSMSTSSLRAQGGSQDIAAIISDTYSPTFKQEFRAWLHSIPDYPKAFKFTMGEITDLVNFRANDLFPDEEIAWGCDGHSDTLKAEEETGKRYYELTLSDNKKKKFYCEFTNRNDLETQLKLKRKELKNAIDIYLQEGPSSVSEIAVEGGAAGCQTIRLKVVTSQEDVVTPTWADITGSPGKDFLVIFNMPADLEHHTGDNIHHNEKRLVTFTSGKKSGRQSVWRTSDSELFIDGSSATTYDCGRDDNNMKVNVLGWCLKYNQDNGNLKFLAEDFTNAQRYFPNIPSLLKGMIVARLEWEPKDVILKGNLGKLGYRPCNVHWSDAFRFDPTRGGKCVHFTAISGGAIYVLFAAIPDNMKSWYYVHITIDGVVIYRAEKLAALELAKSARGLGDSILYQTYFVCMKETDSSTVIEYGKSFTDGSKGDVFLSFIDNLDDRISPRFYGFGAGEANAEYTDVRLTDRRDTRTKCHGSTYKDQRTGQCLQHCHSSCDQTAGCTRKAGSEPAATECNACHTAKDGNKCLDHCPKGKIPKKDKTCKAAFQLVAANQWHEGAAKITHVDLTQDFTICMWMKFDFARLQSGVDHTVFNFRPNSYEEPTIAMYLKQSTPIGALTIVFQVQKNLAKYEVSAGNSTKWFMFCVARDSVSGRVDAYINDKKQEEKQFGRLTAEHDVIHSGPWTLSMGWGSIIDPRHIINGLVYSDWNIFREVLSEREVVLMTERCGQRPGNMKNWFQIKSDISNVITSNYVKKEAGTCAPPAK